MVFLFLALVSLLTAVVFGLAPALHMSKTNVNDVLKEDGRAGGSLRARRWASGLIVGELALTLVLLAGAGFMIRSFMALYRLDVGVDTSNLITMRLVLNIFASIPRLNRSRRSSSVSRNESPRFQKSRLAP